MRGAAPAIAEQRAPRKRAACTCPGRETVLVPRVVYLSEMARGMPSSRTYCYSLIRRDQQRQSHALIPRATETRNRKTENITAWISWRRMKCQGGTGRAICRLSRENAPSRTAPKSSRKLHARPNGRWRVAKGGSCICAGLTRRRSDGVINKAVVASAYARPVRRCYRALLRHSRIRTGKEPEPRPRPLSSRRHETLRVLFPLKNFQRGGHLLALGFRPQKHRDDIDDK